MVIVINSVIGGFGWVELVWLATSTVRLQPTVRLQVSDYSQMSDYSQLSDHTVRLQLYRMISEK